MEGVHSRNEMYRECLRNHAVSLGSYATDGCGDFTSNDSSPASLQCMARGCHRNFHLEVAYAAITPHDIAGGRGGFRGWCGGIGCMYPRQHDGRSPRLRQRIPAGEYSTESGGKKRYRTKFTAEQKEKMMEFAEKLGWRMKRKEQEEEIERF